MGDKRERNSSVALYVRIVLLGIVLIAFGLLVAFSTTVPSP